MQAIKAIFAIGAILSTPATAQQVDYWDNGIATSEGRVMLGLVLPFGGKKSKSAPQLELRMTRDRVGSDGQRLIGLNEKPFVSRIALSLDGQESLFVNGRLVQQEDRKGVSTLGAVAIGLGVAVLVGGALLYADVRDASE